ncbi:hypothetical protein MMC13_001920 [Lambiella insularis]|nr:hypothetical protein [Lambiella insularis]
MPSYFSPNYSSVPNGRLDHSVGESDYKVPQTRNPYYNHPQNGRSNALPMSAPQARYHSRPRWPPPPSVEDEAVSLSREHSPAVPDLVGGEAQARGVVDQNPIILDANPQPPLRVTTNHTNEDGKNGSQALGSKSSSESLGPWTPPGSAHTDNTDRRYIWRPEPNIDIPETYDDPKPKAHAKSQETKLGSGTNAQPKRSVGSEARPGTKIDEKVLPLSPTPERSPYAYSPVSGKSTSSWDYITSPDSVAPELQLPMMPKERKTRIRELSRDISPNGGRHRAASSSFPEINRPSLGRHRSAMAYPGQLQPMNLPQSSTRRMDLSSDESDLSQDESRHTGNSKRSSGHSFVRPEQPRQASALRYDEAVQQTRKIPSHSRTPSTPPLPPRPHSGTWARAPITDPRNYGPGAPATAPLPVKSAMKRSPYSPQPSPLPSPVPSPPASPGLRSKWYSMEVPSPGRISHPPSRPPSPLSSPPPLRSENLGLPSDLHFRDYQPLGGPRSRHTSPFPSSESGQQPLNLPRSRHMSPLPSPEPSYSLSQRETPLDYEGPIPANWSRPSTHIPEIALRPRSREALAPFVLAQPPRPPTLGIPQTRRAHSAIDPHDIPHLVSDPPFRNASKNLLPPVPKPAPKKSLSPRLPLSLPACPRPQYVAGYNDWSTIHSCPEFDICPTCRKAIEDAGWEGRFYPSPSRPPGYETRCDMSIPWVRMAWLLVLQNKAPHPNVVHHIIQAIASEPPCPGKEGAVRNWYRLYDPETNRLVSSFVVCPYCARSLETIFPNLQGTLHLTQSSAPSQRRVCDLRVDSKRFAKYVDLLEEVSTQASIHRRPPNMLRFVQHVHTMAEVRECTRDDMVLDQPWHFMPHLPEFTVCEECYNEAVWPAIANGSEVAGAFNRTLQLMPPSAMGKSCQLYSDRMRQIFRDACRRNDWVGLRTAVMHRVRVERDLQGRLAQLTVHGDARPGVAEEVRGLVAEWKRWE